MKKIKLILLFGALQFAAQIAKAQNPSNDPAWVKIDSLSDDFSRTTIDATKWDVNGGTTWGFPTDGADLAFSTNVIADSTNIIGGVTNGCVVLVVDTLKTHKRLYDPVRSLPGGDDSLTFAYQSGRFNSQHKDSAAFKYGYLEINAKYPKGRLFEWPAFWIWGQYKDCATPSNSWYNEVDITENGGPISYNGYYGTGIPFSIAYTGTCAGGDLSAVNLDQHVIVPNSLDTSIYHKYALEWTPDRLVFYFDDVAFRIASKQRGDSIVNHGIGLIFFNQAYPWDVYLPSDWDRNPSSPGDFTHGYQFPLLDLDAVGFHGTNTAKFLKLDYFRYYKLVKDCSSTLTTSDPSTYDRKIKQWIKTNTASTINYNPSLWNNSHVLRATDYVLLDAPSGSNSITINPSGSGYFAIDIVPCPN